MSTHREHPGLCDASAAVAWHPPQRARWLSPQYRMQRRIALLLVTYLAGAASYALLIGA